MRITKLILKNFASIKKAMDATKLEIDLSTSKNKICLIIAPNGKGKTSVLSQLQPFSDVGTLDVRNNFNLILEGKEGYKELHLECDNDYYIIKHYYTPTKTSHSVKSYISKNGTELNINGNVSSFKEIIKEELQIEPDFLKLIRLGSNVTSLIDLSPAERKNFMGKILDEIGVYLEYYKAVNLKLKQLEEMISHSVDKLNRLKILDKNEFKDDIKAIEKEISEHEKRYLNYNSTLTILKDTLTNIEDSDNLRDNLSETRSKVSKMESTLESKGHTEPVEYYNNLVEEMTKELNENNNKLYTNKALVQTSLQFIDTLKNQLDTIEIQISKEQNVQDEIDRMNENLKNMRLRLRSHEDILGDFKTNITVEEMNKFIDAIKDIQTILNPTYEYGKEIVSTVCDLIMRGENVHTYVSSHLIDIDDKNNNEGTYIISQLASKLGNTEFVKNCDKECPAKEIYMQIQNILNMKNEKKSKTKSSEYYLNIDSAYNNISLVRPKLTEYKSIIDRLPEVIRDNFLTKSIYTNISNLKIIVNFDDLNDYLMLVTEYENYTNLLSEISLYEKEIERYKKISNIKSFEDQRKSLMDSIDTEEEKLNSLKRKISKLNERNDELERDIELNTDISDALSNYNIMVEKLQKYQKDYDLFKDTSNEIVNIKMSIENIKYKLNDLKQSLQEKVIALSQYEELSKDIANMNVKFDEMTFVKRSLSSKEGIPLQYIQNYLNNTTDLTNELLDIAYNGRIYLDEFKITPTEFSIPFYNDGLLLSDVKIASQGELSFLTLALSSALSIQIMKKYNISLWDELDGALDVTNREKFIRILERIQEIVDSEQSFAITHNMMFTSYPVDILDLSFDNEMRKDYPLANIIKVTKE